MDGRVKQLREKYGRRVLGMGRKALRWWNERENPEHRWSHVSHGVYDISPDDDEDSAIYHLTYYPSEGDEIEHVRSVEGSAGPLIVEAEEHHKIVSNPQVRRLRRLPAKGSQADRERGQ